MSAKVENLLLYDLRVGFALLCLWILGQHLICLVFNTGFG